MNWLHFILWVCGIYTLYYLTLILVDIARSGHSPTAAIGHELTFAEDVRPQVLDPGEHVVLQTKREPAIIASGGVSVKDMFGLARKEMIVFTRAVSF